MGYCLMFFNEIIYGFLPVVGIFRQMMGKPCDSLYSIPWRSVVLAILIWVSCFVLLWACAFLDQYLSRCFFLSAFLFCLDQALCSLHFLVLSFNLHSSSFSFCFLVLAFGVLHVLPLFSAFFFALYLVVLILLSCFRLSISSSVLISLKVFLSSADLSLCLLFWITFYSIIVLLWFFDLCWFWGLLSSGAQTNRHILY